MSDAILVLGMHRSGTSAISGTLIRLGGGSPKSPMLADEGNVRGYFESIPFWHFHDELLASADSSWKDWRAFNPGWDRSPVAADFRRRAKQLFVEEFAGSPMPVLKDPRICRFAPFWFGALREMDCKPHVVIPIRSPLDVARSLSASQKISVAHASLLWLRHVLDAEAQSRDELRSIFTWPDFRDDWRGVCEKIAHETRLSWPRLSDRAARDIELFLAKELVHHDTGLSALVGRADVHKWTLQAYEALLELARSPFSNSAFATLDELRARLDEASGLFGRLVVDYEAQTEEARERAEAAIRDRDAERARAEQAERERGEAQFAREESQRALQAAERARDEAERERAEARRALEETERARDEAESRLEEAERVRAEAESRLEAAERARAETRRELEEAQRLEAETGQTLESLARSLEAATAERDRLEQARSALTDQLNARLRELEDKTTAVSEISIRARQAEARREEWAQKIKALERRLETAEVDRRHADTLAARLEQTSLELQLSRQRAAEEEAAHGNALAEALQSADAATRELRARTAEAEAAAAFARAKAARKGWLSRLSPDGDARRIARKLLRSGLFDEEFYRGQYPQARDAAAAAEHYVTEGCFAGLRPNPYFDTRWYLETNEDIRRSGVNPLLHYLLNGAREGRDPGPNFQTTYYLEANPDVRAQGANPLAHFLLHGRHEGRPPRGVDD